MSVKNFDLLSLRKIEMLVRALIDYTAMTMRVGSNNGFIVKGRQIHSVGNFGSGITEHWGVVFVCATRLP